MAIRADVLFELARRVELSIAALYEDMAALYPVGGDAMQFFSRLSAQEHTHAQWVDEMAESIPDDFEFENLAEDDFAVILTTIEDIHDEVLTEGVGLLDSLEIILHLENSTAEEFYLHFPANAPGLDQHHVERMIRSCFDHAKSIELFRRQQLAKN